MWAKLTSVEGYAINHYGTPLGLALFGSGSRYPQTMGENLILHQATAYNSAGPSGPLYAVPGNRGIEHGGASAGAVFGGSSAVPQANTLVWATRTRYTGQIVGVCMMDRAVLEDRLSLLLLLRNCLTARLKG